MRTSRNVELKPRAKPRAKRASTLDRAVNAVVDAGVAVATMIRQNVKSAEAFMLGESTPKHATLHKRKSRSA